MLPCLELKINGLIINDDMIGTHDQWPNLFHPNNCTYFCGLNKFFALINITNFDFSP